MTLSEIAKLRLQAQLINNHPSPSPQEIVWRFGAIQAQDFEMSKWALGTRLNKKDWGKISTDLEEGKILRTHLLRPTWHLVSAEDIYWILDLSAPQIKQSMKSRAKQLALTEDFIKSTNHLIRKNLAEHQEMTRNQLKEVMIQEKIDLKNNRLSHILMYAELNQVICSGSSPGKDKNPSYALLEERVPVKKRLSREEALFELGLRYFKSHGPARLQDFTWWSGLKVKDAKQSLEMLKNELISEIVEEETYWLYPSQEISLSNKDQLFLLAAYDEYIIAYENRKAVLLADFHQAMISKNGVFWPIIVLNGKVIGKWKRIIKKDKVKIDIELFEKQSASIQDLITMKAKQFGEFLSLETLLIFL